MSEPLSHFFMAAAASFLITRALDSRRIKPAGRGIKNARVKKGSQAANKKDKKAASQRKEADSHFSTEKWPRSRD
jgi:hypothetical protein